MARSKRPLSPVADRHSSKRLRLQHPSQEVIIVDGDGVNVPPQAQAERTGDDPDIELIDNFGETEALRKFKGKQKARTQTGAENDFTDDPMDGSVQDGEALALITRKDEELALRLAMEWAPESSPGPEAGPSLREDQGPSSSSIHFSTSDDIEIIEPPTKEAIRGAPSSHKPTMVLSGSSAANLDIPDIKLPNPEHRLKVIKKLLTAHRECPKCNTLTSPPWTPATVEPHGHGEYKIPLNVLSLLHLQCPNKACGAGFCRGCFRSVACFPKCHEPGTMCEAAECCANARAIALYEVLSAFDREYLADKASAESRAKEMKKNSTASKVKTVGPGGTGYAAEFDDDFDFDPGFDLEEDGYSFEWDDKTLVLDQSSLDQLFATKMTEIEKVMQSSTESLSYSAWGATTGGFKKPSGSGKGVGQVWSSSLKGGVGKESFTTNLGHLKRGKSRGAQSSRRKEKQEARGEQTVSEADQKVTDTLQLLIELLPAPYSSEPAVYDLLPHPSLGALVLSSFVPTVLAQLLRNDSVVDWTARSSVYHAMLTLLKRMADCELTIPILVGYRPQFSSPGLSAWMWNKGQFVWQRDEGGEVEMALPLLEHFKKLKKQAETFLQTTRAQFCDDDGDPAFTEGWSLCADIVSAQDNIKRATGALHQLLVDNSTDVQASFGPSAGSSASISGRAGPVTRSSARASKGKGKAVQPTTQARALDMEKEYSLACEKLSFGYVSLAKQDIDSKSGAGLDYPGYNFARELKQTQNATRIPKDRIHFAKELAVMATSLPPGIWVRVDEVRNDAMRVMIAGPQGTPYAGGLFEFDCFIPLEYPKKPPVMHLRTTGRGTVRFNPNLYNDGKVCLSLLGTWTGTPEEQWTPKSTLLQVLVSIQSMILNEAPYFNEPGHGQANLKHPDSIKYNSDTALQTVRWAMVHWLKDEHRDGIWKEVIKSHFTLRKDTIQEQINLWAKDDPRMRDYHASLRTSGKAAKNTISAVYQSFSGLRLPPPPGPSQTPNMDLVAELDAGMRRVEAWPSEG